MGVIDTDLRDINFLTTVFCLFFPDGSVVSINKIYGFSYHKEYLQILAEGNDLIREMVASTSYSYYIDAFCKNGCAVYMNLAPDSIVPTVNSLLFLPEEVSSEMNATFRLAEEKLSLLKFYGIAKYSSSASEFSSCIEAGEVVSVSELYKILDELRGKFEVKKICDF